MRLTRAEQLDRELIKKLRPGKRLPIARVTSLSKRSTAMIDRRLSKHGWRLRETKSGELEVIGADREPKALKGLDGKACKGCAHFRIPNNTYIYQDGKMVKTTIPTCAEKGEIDLEIARQCADWRKDG